MPIPRLTFFCELPSHQLATIVDEQIIADMVSIKASLSMGLLDFSAERAEVVQRLNQRGIPVIAWLLLPKDKGYWFNLYNAPHAITCYQNFKDWTAEYGLIWDGVGLDIEPDIREIKMLFANRLRLFPGIIRRLFNNKLFTQAQLAYRGLVEQIRMDGYRVDSYQFPIIADERRVGSKLLQRAIGLIDIPADREVWMLYSSFLRPNGPGVLVSYAPESQSIGVGSAGGGVDSDFIDVAPLSWEELARDLRLAWHWCPDIHIFSLEGCVQQGFFKKLIHFVWDYPTIVPEQNARRVDSLRGLFRLLLWGTAHSTAILIGLAGMVLFVKAASRLLRRS